jgi:hypothetical protein
VSRDIVERLRRAADTSASGGGEWYQLVHRCREAADEIERLRALADQFCWHDIATLTADLAAERAEVERLRAEVDQLNGALWKIREISDWEARRER